jgi:enoyl-CoA hydratase/carnithine racemase
MKAENEEFSVQVHSGDAREAIRAVLEKRPPNFAGSAKSTAEA